VEGRLVLLDDDVLALPPRHLLRLLEKVVTHPARDREDRDGLLDEVLLPAGLHKHGLHLLLDLSETRLLVLGDVAVHLVDTNDELLDTEKVDETRVLAGLALDLTGLVVATGDGGHEVTVRRHHDVTGARHVVLVEALDVETDVVTGLGVVATLNACGASRR